MNPSFGKVLILAGVVLILVGLIVKFNLAPWLGKLPGDIRIERENIRFYFPVATSLLLSLIASLLLVLLRK